MLYRLVTASIAVILVLLVTIGVSRQQSPLVNPTVEKGLDWARTSLASVLEAVRPDDSFERAITGERMARDVDRRTAPAAPAAIAPPPPVPQNCSEPDVFGAGVALVGDSLSLRFFERDPAGQSESDAPVSFERLDLSGVYAVDAEGQLSLPLMGRVAVEGLTLSCVEALTAARYAETFRATGEIQAGFGGRAPVLITGAVRSPGAYHVNPGMKVRHVLGLAGSAEGISAPATVASGPLLGRRAELKRLRAGVRLEMLALERARAGEPDLGLTAAKRAAFITSVGVGRLDSEAANLRTRVKEAVRARDELTARLEGEKALVELRIAGNARLEKEVADKRVRLDALRGLSDRGLATLSRLSDDESALSLLERSFFDGQLNLVSARERVAELEAELAALDLRSERAIALENRDLAKEAEAIDAQIESIDMQLAAASPPKAVGSEQYTVTRTTSHGISTFVAKPSDLVLPGDLIEVSQSGSLALSLD
jgi:polysaccharide export outer membrane protein